MKSPSVDIQIYILIVVIISLGFNMYTLKAVKDASARANAEEYWVDVSKCTIS